MKHFPLVVLMAGLVLGTAALPRESRAVDTPAAALDKMVLAAERYGSRSAFVFDLDETTVDSSPRRYESLLDAIDEACTRTPTPASDCERLRFIKLEDLYRLRNRYDDLVYLRRYGTQDEAFIATIGARAQEIYLSGRYIADKDRLYVGVQSFVRDLKRAGARVFFVSSRSLEHQGRATLRFLRERGLLRAGEESFLYLRPDAEKSPDFKRRATREIRERVSGSGGRVDGIFENEPENLAIWIENFPNARAFFVTGAYLRNGPVARKAVILEDFRR